MWPSAIRRLQSDAAAKGETLQVMVVDTDVHQGNGTAAIFAGDSSRIHLIDSSGKQLSDAQAEIRSRHQCGRCGGRRRISRTARCRFGEAFGRFKPDLIFYVGGADPYREDQLGGLWLTLGGLRKRDALVFGEARRRGVPVAVTLAGGYARNVADTVRIHVETVMAARDIANEAVLR